MDLVRWNPFREMASIRNELNRLFSGSVPAPTSGLEAWTPAVDILEDEKTITIKMEIPEVDKEDVNVSVERDALVVKGERKLEKEEKKDNYQRIERSYGSFYRSFALPDYVDQDKLAAECKDGVLRITLPKTKPAKAESKQIKVK